MKRMFERTETVGKDFVNSFEARRANKKVHPCSEDNRLLFDTNSLVGVSPQCGGHPFQNISKLLDRLLSEV